MLPLLIVLVCVIVSVLLHSSVLLCQPEFPQQGINKGISYLSLQAVTKDGFGCIRCPGSLTDEGQCQCPPGNVLGESPVTLIYELHDCI